MDNRVFWSVLSALIVFAGIGVVFFDLVPAVYYPVPLKPLVVYADAGVMSEVEMMRRRLAPGDICTDKGVWLQTAPGHMRVTNYQCGFLADRRLR